MSRFSAWLLCQAERFPIPESESFLFALSRLFTATLQKWLAIVFALQVLLTLFHVSVRRIDVPMDIAKARSVWSAYNTMVSNEGRNGTRSTAGIDP